ncbi:MAG: DNA primase [Candidatus Erginobacter occultus]|nr:DNA primase [Candidatus Erginobacter occultus]
MPAVYPPRARPPGTAAGRAKIIDMAPLFSPDQVDLVNSSNDIVEVVSQYLPLKRSGRNFKALCPFHSEKTPSFTVSPDKQIFHCFGCGAGGDVFSFVMRKENMTFPEAVRYLARRANVQLPEADPRAASRREKLFELHRLAADYFHWGLTRSRAGERAREYLNRREITKDSIKTFEIGYAQPGWESLLNRARKKGYPEELLVEAGLVIKREKGGGCYDRFRDRLIVPVRDGRGRTIAFGGRVLDDSLPKYINSPETPLFRKGGILFGIDRARVRIGEAGEAIIGEGYFDVIRAHQEGVENMVCSQGTAFTEIQAQVLKRYTDKVVVAFDADQAGTAAALRGLAVFLEKNFEVRIIVLPPGEDPDSFIRKHSGPAFEKLAQESRPLLDFKLDWLCKQYDIAADRGRMSVARQMLESISLIENAVLRETYLRKLAGRLGVSPEAVQEEFGKRKPPAPPSRTPAAVPEGKIDKYQLRLLKYLMGNDTFFRRVEEELYPDVFSPPLQPVVTLMLELIRQGQVPLSKTLVGALRDRRAQEMVSGWLLDSDGSGPEVGEAVQLIINLARKRVRSELLRARRELAAREGLEEDRALILRRCAALQKELQSLPSRIREKAGL